MEANVKSLNSGDVFILDLGLELFQYNGATANKYTRLHLHALRRTPVLTSLVYDHLLLTSTRTHRYEVRKAFGIIHALHNERGARGTITLMVEDPHNKTFWDALGGEIEVVLHMRTHAQRNQTAYAETCTHL